MGAKTNAPNAGRQKSTIRPFTPTPSTLPSLEALLRLVDDVDPALALHEAIVAVPVA
jgi:hypothetical protein